VPTIDLTPFYQPQGSTSDGTKYDNALALVQSTMNGLDHSNFVSNPNIPLTALAQNPLGAPLALTGATAATRYVGATASGAPASGTFSTGDFAIDQTGKVWVCTAAGSPGSWAQVGGGGANSGAQIDYAQITADVSITHTTEGTADTVVTGNSITYDGTKNNVEFWCPNITSNAIAAVFVLLRDSTVLGQAISSAANVINGGFKAEVFDTPTAAAHTYAVKAFQSSVGTLTVKAGAGGSGVLLPPFLRVTKA